MGYTTDFEGRFTLDKPLTEEHAAYLTAFSDTRRMKRSAERAAAMPDPVRAAVGLPIGEDGGYFVGGGGFAGQEHDASVMDYNGKPHGQPGIWCKWVPTEDRAGIEWSGAEKFYDYDDWLRYICAHFLEPWGYTLSGSVTYQGEDPGDRGKVHVVRIGTDPHRVSKVPAKE